MFSVDRTFPVNHIFPPQYVEWKISEKYGSAEEIATALFAQYRSTTIPGTPKPLGYIKYAIPVTWESSDLGLRHLFCVIQGKPHLFIIASKKDTRAQNALHQGGQKTSRIVKEIFTSDDANKIVPGVDKNIPLIFFKNKNKTHPNRAYIDHNTACIEQEVSARETLRHISGIDQPLFRFNYLSKKGREKCCLIFQKHPMDLEALLKQGPVDLNTQRNIEQTLLSTLSQIHQTHVIHRDIKPKNILLDEKNTPRLIDFGLACPRIDPPKNVAGAPKYFPPEAVLASKLPAHPRAQAPAERIFSPAQDVWALGLVFIELTNPSHPILDKFQDKNIKDCEKKFNDRVNWLSPLMQSAIRNPYADLSSLREEDPCPYFLDILGLLDQNPNPINDLLKKMFNPDFRYRITATEALKELKQIIAAEEKTQEMTLPAGKF